MARKPSTTFPTPAKVSGKNKPGDIGITSTGKYKVWTGRGWSGDYESQTGAINQMHILHGDIGPRLVEAPTSTKRKRGGTVSRKGGGNIMKGRKAGGKMSHQGLYTAEEKRSGTLPERERKKGGAVKRKKGGTIKKQAGGLTQGYDARLDESLAARHPAVRRNLAARRAESEGMERALGHRPYSAARTMAKKGGSVSRKKGGTTSRKGGGKIMVGYKAGGKV